MHMVGLHVQRLHLATVYRYNGLNRLTDMASTRTLTTGIGDSLTVYSTAPLAAFNYNYSDVTHRWQLGLAGQRMGAVETINVSVSMTINRMVGYTYDNLYRLAKENIVSDTGVNDSNISAPTGGLDYTAQTQGGVSYPSYDSVGNRQSRLVTLSPAVPGLSTVTASFDAQDHVTTSSYDANGNTTLEALPAPAISPTSGTKDQYDFENRLVQRSDGTTTITIVYDGDGNRVSKIVTGPNAETRYYLVDDQNQTGYAQVLEESIATGDTRSVTRQYTYGHALVSATLDPFSQTPQTVYYGFDGHGNVRYLMNIDGTITDTYTYDAFGVLISKKGSTANSYLYCAERFDFDLGTYYLRARQMNPNTGRFWTMDATSAIPEDPPSLHRYLYCANNPVCYIDPNGQSMLGDLILSISIRVGEYATYLVPIASKATIAIATIYIMTSIVIGVDETFCGGTQDETLYDLRDASGNLLIIATLITEGLQAVALSPPPRGSLPPPARRIQILRSRAPESYEHINDAQKAGYPRFVTVDRSNKVQRRAAGACAARCQPRPAGDQVRRRRPSTTWCRTR